MHHHAEDLAVDAQLFVRADTIGVRGDQGQLFRAVAHHAAGRQLGRAGGLADTGRADQRKHAALLQHGVFIGDGIQVTTEDGLDPAHALRAIEAGGQLVDQVARQAGRETGGQHFAQHHGFLRLALLRRAPRDFRQLGFHHAAHGADFIHHAAHLGGGVLFDVRQRAGHHLLHAGHVHWLAGCLARCGRTWRSRALGRGGRTLRRGELGLQLGTGLGHFGRGRRRRQRSGIVIGQREDFHHAIGLAVRQDHGIGAQRFAHLAQRIARRGARKFLHIHDRPPKAGGAQYWLNCVTIVDSCCLGAVFHMDTDHPDSFHY